MPVAKKKEGHFILRRHLMKILAMNQGKLYN